MRNILVQILNKKIACILIIALSIILVMYSLIVVPTREGDGYEYALILQSFLNHLSPDIRQSDIESLLKIVQTQPSSYNPSDIQKILDAFNRGDNEIFLGILKSNQGDYFGYHFWIYSLINIPAKVFLMVFGLNELKAFQLTNSLLIISVLVYVLLFSKQSTFFRWTIAITYLVGCSIFYLKWPHPEVFLAACILIASCAFIDRRFHFAVTVAALATLQNPSVIFFLGLIVLFYVAQDFSLNSLKKPISWIKNRFSVLLIASTALLPYIFYYYYYKKFNLIATRGFVDTSLIGLNRFYSTLFDLNQGFVVGFPGILIGILIIIIYRLMQTLLQKKKPFFNSSDILFLAFFLITFPTLSQTNLNHGHEVLIRYGSWIPMVLIVWFVTNLESMRGFTRLIILVGVIGLQLLPNILFFKYPKYASYLQMKPLPAWLLTHFPSWYNPEPEIFAERTREYERFGETIAPNPIDSPFIFLDKTGTIRKILIYQSQVSKVQSRLCGPDGKLANNDNNISLRTLLSEVKFNNNGWGYINGSFHCTLPFSLSFAEGGNSGNYTLKGWSKPNIKGTEIKFPKARLMLPLRIEEEKQDIKLFVKLYVDTDLAKDLPRIRIMANDKPIAEWKLTSRGQVSQYEAIIPKESYSSQPLFFLDFSLISAEQSNFSPDSLVKITLIDLKIVN